MKCVLFEFEVVSNSASAREYSECVNCTRDTINTNAANAYLFLKLFFVVHARSSQVK